ncbi:hypothetical protein [Rhodococcus koreensis]
MKQARPLDARELFTHGPKPMPGIRETYCRCGRQFVSMRALERHITIERHLRSGK